MNGYGHKRRKLSHASDDKSDMRTQKDDTEDINNKFSTEDNDNPDRISAENARDPGRRTRGDAIMSTSNTSKSSLMLLQINELLGEVGYGQGDYRVKLKPVTDQVVRAIKSIPNQPPATLLEAEKIMQKKSGVAIPFGNHRPDDHVKYKFAYNQPETVVVQDTLAWQSDADYEEVINVMVQMPSNLFQEKDYLNHRALHKRAYYVACIAAGLKENLDKNVEICYQFHDGNDLVPTIAIRGFKSGYAKDRKTSQIEVQILFPEGVRQVEKTGPDRNCVRSDNESRNDGSAEQIPTPFYNSTINQLASSSQVDSLIEQAVERCEAYADACMLGKIWLRQRGFKNTVDTGGFGSKEWAYMCALLLIGGGHKARPLFSERYSSLQLFKAMLQVLAHRDLTEPLLIRTNNLHLPRGELPVICDGITGMNVLFKMSLWSYEALKHHAQISLAAANTRDQDNFRSLFIFKVANPFLQSDEIFNIDLSKSTVFTKNRTGNYLQRLYSAFRKGLGDRALLINLRQTPRPAWDTADSGTKQSRSLPRVEIQILTNPDAASRLIDHGPSAEQHEEAHDFRQFWGEKSELRRFRDGSITETLVWVSNKPVIQQIIEYLSAYHFKLLPTSVQRRTPDLQHQELATSIPITADDAFKLIGNKYQQLSSQLHQLEGLPLSIRNISPTSEALRSTSIQHPLSPDTSLPIDVLIQFDSSARWPDHLPAIQYTKIAFLAKLSDLITETDTAATTRIGTENTEISTTGYYNAAFLDIVYPSPAQGLSSIVFRLRIHNDRESHLLQNILAEKSLPGASRDVVTAALSEQKRNFLALPIHTTAIRNLMTHFPFLSATTRLLKRWIASHSLSNHVPSTVCEIIAAHVFLHPYPWSTPGTPTTAFLHCLHFLSHWDWTNTPLITDLSLSQDMPSTQTTELETRFRAWRKLDPQMNTVCWFIGTNLDNTGTVWTQGAQPPRVIAARVTTLAKAALDLIKDTEEPSPSSSSSSSSNPDWRSMFVSSTEHFDFIIHLKKSVVRGDASGGGRGEKFKNLQIQDELDVTRVGHDVVELYLADLQRCFGTAVLFFHGSAQTYIAGLWRPGVAGRRDWRVRLGYSTIPCAGEEVDGDGEVKGSAEANKQGMLAEMALLGEGMIDKFSVRN